MTPSARRTRALSALPLASLALLVLLAAPTASAWDNPRTDVERFSVIPDATHFFFLRQAQLGEDLPDWGVGLVFQWAPRHLQYRQNPAIGDRTQVLVKNRTELNPYFYWRAIKGNDHSLTLSGLLPIVIKSGAVNSSIANGDLVDADIEDKFTLGDLHLGLAYAGRMHEKVIGGVALDLRLPTGAINTKTLATDNLVRIIPRLNLAWLPTDWFELDLDIGNQFTLPGYDDEGPLTGPLTTRNFGNFGSSEPLFSETFFQAGMTFKLPKQWFISFEAAYWFNTLLMLEPKEDFAMQLDLLLSVGARFDVSKSAAIKAHVGGRWNPFLDSRRQVGPTHGQLLVKLGVDGTPQCDPPELRGVSYDPAPSPQAGSENCVNITEMTEVQSGGSGGWMVVAGRPYTLSAVAGESGDVTIEMVGETKTATAKDDETPFEVSGTIPKDAPLGPQRVSIANECDLIDEKSLTVCPIIDPVLPNDFVVDGAIHGQFSVDSSVRYAISVAGDEPIITTAEPTEEGAKLVLPNNVLLPMGNYDVTITAVSADGATDTWVAGCPGRRVRVNVNEPACCSNFLRHVGVDASEFESLGYTDTLGAPKGCAYQAVVHFEVGQADWLVTAPPGAEPGAMTAGTLPEDIQRRAKSWCNMPPARLLSKALGNFQSLMSKIRRVIAVFKQATTFFNGVWRPAGTAGASIEVNVIGRASPVSTWTGKALKVCGIDSPFDDNLNRQLATRRLNRMMYMLCDEKAETLTDLTRKLTQPNDVAIEKKTAPTQCLGVSTQDETFRLRTSDSPGVEAHGQCPTGSQTPLPKDRGSWIDDCYKGQKSKFTIVIKLPRVGGGAR